ncbi:MAG: M42 family peptidase [Clostridia bacterium]|nr:M42 family peptidase [Clostridia bacterium]
MKELLRKLSGLRGISGYEYRISDKISELFKPVADEVHTDKLGNVIAVKHSTKVNAPRLMIEAHMDEIGLMVRDIDENGFIGFVNIGGVDTRILPSCEVIIHAKEDICGVIGAKPPHLQTAGEADDVSKIQDMAIDTGLSADKVKSLVSVGDAITIKGGFCELLGGRVSGKSLDDRAGVAVLVKLLEKLSDVKLDFDLYAVSAVCEEVNGSGAATSGYAINPDMAVAIDVTHGITPDNSKNAFELGSGVAIAKGPNLHPALTDRLISTAKNNDIKYNVEVEGGNTGTDAWLLQVAREGIPTALLSIPLRYMHTSVETLELSDVEAVCSLLERFCVELDCDLEGWLCI